MSSAEKRLCVITPTHWAAFMGGAEYQVKCLLDALVQLDRYKITYIANRVAPDFEPENYRVIPVGGHILKFGRLVHAVPLYRALLTARPDVIYQRVACAYTGIAAYYARRHGARLVWHVASDTDVRRDSSPFGWNPVRHLLEQTSVNYGIRHARHIVTQTKYQATLLQTNYGRAADAVIPNFHPTPSERIDKTGPPVVLWVANLKPFKRPEAFVRLAEALHDLKDIRFVIVGAFMAAPQDQHWEEALRDQMKSVPNLDYLGQKTQDEVNELFARAHLFVNTSELEGFPNTFIQAWMREVPVVSLNANPDDVMHREKIGVCAGSEEMLHQVVRKLLTDTHLREEYATRARHYADKSHSMRNALLLAELFDTGEINEPVVQVQ